MTDAHFHRSVYDTFLALDGREFRFFGVHPWQVNEGSFDVSGVRPLLEGDVHAGVGEIGLDRLKAKVVSEAQRDVFARLLELADEFRRPVVLHGAKCWGEVVKACRPHRGRIPAFLFHGFSRSEGLLPDIFALNGFVSIGPALLNDHAVNYREMVKRLPLDRVLLETDRDWGASAAVDTEVDPPSQEALLTSLAHTMSGLTNCPLEALTSTLAANAARFVESLA